MDLEPTSPGIAYWFQTGRSRDSPVQRKEVHLLFFSPSFVIEAYEKCTYWKIPDGEGDEIHEIPLFKVATVEGRRCLGSRLSRKKKTQAIIESK